ncbi:hypothetical protein D3C71_77140 [compost metagenome]
MSDAFATDFNEMLSERLQALKMEAAPHNDQGMRYQASEHIPFFAMAQSPEELEEITQMIGRFAYEAATKMETDAATLCPNLQVLEKDAPERVRTNAMDFALEMLTPTERYREYMRDKVPETPEGIMVTLNLSFAVFHNVFAYGVSTSIWAPDPDPASEEVWSLGTIQNFDSTLVQV